ncbi:MAG: VWA domain-containing protein [Acidobacteria bacterium]|nr:VWA domain-containing protein [Acidobacteriota bacterium]
MKWMLALAAAVACLCGIDAAGGQQPVFRGAGDVVRVFATVTDRDDRLVTTLTRDDFEVRDEGKPQPLTLFDNAPQRIRLIVMLDVSGSMAGNILLLRAAAEQLFTRLRPDDVARVGTFGHDVIIGPSDFTGDPTALQAALPRTIDADAPTPLWRGIDEALDGFGAETDARRVILVLSDGKDSGPLGFGGQFFSQADAIDRARDEDVMVYGIGMRSRGVRPRQPGIGPGALQAMLMADLPDHGLALVARETGGGYTEIRFGQDLAAAFAQVADELHSQYLLGFSPPKRDGKVHDISVRVAQRGLDVRARRTYVAPRDQ